jgi:hypothetical protein
LSGTYLWNGDVNGDGKDDLITIYSNKVFTYISNGDGTYQVVQQNLTTGQ